MSHAGITARPREERGEATGRSEKWRERIEKIDFFFIFPACFFESRATSISKPPLSN